MLAVSGNYRWVFTAEGNIGDCTVWQRREFFVDGVLNPDINGVGNIDTLM